MSVAKSKFVVVDSGAFIKNASIENFGDEIYTIQAVVQEIRDKQTRSRLQVLPYSLNFREPSTQSISHVNEIAKRTGDFRSLSATDIRVIALTYEMHEQYKDIKLPPVTSEDKVQPKVKKVDYRDAFGDIYSDDEPEEAEESEEDESEEEEEEEEEEGGEEEMNCEMSAEKADDEAAESGEASADVSEEVLKISEEPKCQAMEVSDEDEDDWITADNISSHDFSEDFQSFKSDKSGEDSQVTPVVSCLTTDFAMQNVLLSMGLCVRSVDGFLVKSPKSFVLWCYACNKHTLDPTKRFCPSCGNKTLKKITASLDKAGNVKLYFAKKFQWSNKGKNKQTDAHFHGGKYSNNAVYTEDQPMPHQRPSKKAVQRLDPEASSADCPFATRDLSSRAAKLGMNKRFRGGRRK